MRDFWDYFGGIIITLTSAILIGVILCLVCAYPELKIFNQSYNTNYTVWQWLCAEETIKDYANKEGKHITINLKDNR